MNGCNRPSILRNLAMPSHGVMPGSHPLSQYSEIRYIQGSPYHLPSPAPIRHYSNTSKLDEHGEDITSHKLPDQTAYPDGEDSIGFITKALPTSGNDVLKYSPANVCPTRKRSKSNRLKKALRPSSLEVLGKWLDLQDDNAREAYWQELRSKGSKVSESALPTILLQHIRRCPLTMNMTLSLEKRGFSKDDLVIWAWILQGQHLDEKAKRFFSSPSRKPTFILLEILRHDIEHVETFRSLLVYTWAQFFSVNSQECVGGSWSGVSESLFEEEADDSDNLLPFSSPGMEGTTFKVLISRLLYQARRLLPSAVFPISHMIPPYFFHHLNHGLLHVLSLPSRLEPLRSMGHNWHAQRVLLRLANRTSPPLIIDRLGYQSVQAVLLASQKTKEESRLAMLQARDWPPWRVDQDGMDAQRSSDEDMSRIVFAIRQMKQAGYSSSSNTHVYGILGGQEDDGTPTIHTRSMSKAHIRRQRSLVKLSPLNPHVWSARIKATRDVQEAWSAFKNFRHQGGTPTPSVYLAVMEKIEAENKRIGQSRMVDVLPGEGKEVLPPFSDNFSAFYKEELRPPSTIDSLYETMISSGIHPDSDCLRFMVSHARGIPDGIKYLRDSAQRDTFLDYLIGQVPDPPAKFTSAETRIIHAFVALLCRCADKLAPRAPSNSDFSMFQDFKGLHESSLNIINDINADGVMPQTLPRSKKSGINPLSHTLELIRTSQTKYRPTWYAVFDALARPGIIIDPNIIGDPQDDVNSWRISVATLQDFHDAGLELDPKGFQLICRCLEKAMLATSRTDEEPLFVDAIHLVKGEFAKLSSATTKCLGLSALSYNLNGAILHAYIRVLGLSKDFNGIQAVVEWMILHHKSLLTEARWSRNGHELLRRTLIAIKVFCNGTSHEDQARELVESVEGWTWPSDEDAIAYIEGCTSVAPGGSSSTISEPAVNKIASYY
ncbi:hypothetical protein SBOR_3449 [Sclerotinia borealis F-4128]|uniref:Uncharacterized protein n=1 Tax=Sclerotinia borealis (strain F-4128) TaxID=1432307 RepID=W9CND9_SCLBF|nr:hypothetical protein SBOR_3449 [Sclerotinia borealis F-4128]